MFFQLTVFAVKLRRDRVVVVLSTKVYVYRFSDLKLIDQISTLPNPKGIVSLCPDPSNNVLAIPGMPRPYYTALLCSSTISLIFPSLLYTALLFSPSPSLLSSPGPSLLFYCLSSLPSSLFWTYYLTNFLSSSALTVLCCGLLVALIASRCA